MRVCIVCVVFGVCVICVVMLLLLLLFNVFCVFVLCVLYACIICVLVVLVFVGGMLVCFAFVVLTRCSCTLQLFCVTCCVMDECALFVCFVAL